jgi:hypothetical protein
VKESSECVVDLVEDQPEIVARMLLYIYGPEYYTVGEDFRSFSNRDHYDEGRMRLSRIPPGRGSGDTFNSAVNTMRLTTHALLHGVSRKYDIPGLRNRTRECFLETAQYLLEIDPTLTDWFLTSDDIIDAIKIIYGTEQESDRIFKEGIVYIAQRLAKFMGAHDEKRDVRPFRQVLMSLEDFAWDMVSMDFEKSVFRCGRCQETFDIYDYHDEKDGCGCAGRGICGDCPSVDQLACRKCESIGGCVLLWRKNDGDEPSEQKDQKEV